MKIIYRFMIGLYQKYLSPRKGYRCAYSLEHGGSGCSGAVLNILETHGLFRGWSLIKHRFHECSEAAEKRKKRKKEGSGSCPDCSTVDNACEGANCGLGCANGAKKCDLPDMPDCGSCDCGGLSLAHSDDCQSCKNCGFANIFSRRKS